MPTSSSQQSADLPAVIQAMAEPEFYPHPAENIEVRQTHISYVLLAGQYAYKVCKPVRFAFLDCSTVARRRHMCERALELNRRLSPDVYLAVVPIIRRDNRFALDESGVSAEALEFALKMRRLPDDRRLDEMVARGAAATAEIHAVANTVGNFHAGASNSNSWDYGAAAAVWQMTIGNLAEFEQLAPDGEISAKAGEIEAFCRRYIAAHWELLNRRARHGCVREGHGDLRADAIYLTTGGIRIIDCLEFDERLRYGDIASEIAFLAMDLDRLNRPGLSNELARQFASDPDIQVLLSFYKTYRASVRAKVELLRSQQTDRSAEEQARGVGNAMRLLDLALAYAAGPKALIVVCGASGTGKSTLAALLGDHLGLVIFNSDIERKRLAGLEPSMPAAAGLNQGIYSPEMTERVYSLLAANARNLLAAGKGVILDATFAQRKWRTRVVELAKELGVELFFIECRADQGEVVRRLKERARNRPQPSDATVETYLQQLKEFEPLDEIPAAWYRVAKTTGDLRSIVAEVEPRIWSRHYRQSASE